ncbi:MAG: hypothetical protein HKN47_08100 [Pirellulaceae bacterium]|nr:hypothetical protein [Pirellulaceae bacterium]
MKRILLLCVVVGIGVCVANRNRAADPPKKPASKVSPLMYMKLDKSKSILEGLTLEDYDQIGSNARSLKLLSLESGWNVMQTKTYQRHGDDFRRICDMIDEAAGEKDIHRAALGYVALTVSCVECHSYMRKQNLQPNARPTKQK